MFPPTDGSSQAENSEELGIPDYAVNATTAAYHADVAAKHAVHLAQWVQYLQCTLGGLQSKVTELEAWKRNAMEDVRKLRDEHKALRKQVTGEEDTPAALPAKAKSMPSVMPAHFDEDRPAPGLELTDPEPAPGLKLTQPPRLSQPSSDSLGSWASHSSPDDIGAYSFPSSYSLISESASDLDVAHSDSGQLEGITIACAEVEGMECTRAEWRIGNLSTKLRQCMGRALVSSPFVAAGLEDLRLMICPEGKDATKGPRSRRQKELYAKKVTEGPLEACLKLKALTSDDANKEIRYFLTVGSARTGPFTHSFAESTVSGCDDFGVDWLKQLDADMSLTVCIDILHS